TTEAELSARRSTPTVTPIFSVSQVVLPGGHIWDANGNHQFNFSEVPAPFRAAFREQLQAPSPSSALVALPGAPIRVQIPAIEVNASIRSGDDWISLQAGVGHPGYSANPGQGNTVLVAHNDIYGEVFRDLEDLRPGDEVIIQAQDGRVYTYVVRESQ